MAGPPPALGVGPATSLGASIPAGSNRDASHSLSSDSIEYGRFLPGTILAGRYRILGLLGRGGMGEVYKADDIRIGQLVALKFLPPVLARDPQRVARLAAEVRAARQVSHPNVCRVYDMADIDGEHFISMEFVDGEDLASLLRRIGRVPDRKAIQIARQMSEGLAAAHDRGVLHRDFKPSNVMIDGRGDARIADFGLAGFAEEGSREGIAGTPGYMAPEQFAGKGTSPQSDVYALGLVLYEVFTGVPGVRAGSVAEYATAHAQGAPAAPSTLVPGLDPLVERVILKCLEKAPESRPPNARAVAASLPGGDPLAAALAMGETPSPQAVAGAARAGSLSPAIAGAILAGLLVSLIAVGLMKGRVSLFAFAPPERPPAVLAQQARDLTVSLGYTTPPIDWAGWYETSGYLDNLRRNARAAIARSDLETVKAPLLQFWYRQSPRVMSTESLFAEGAPSYSDPPILITGMTNVVLDPRGKLISFIGVAPEFEAHPKPPAPPDWTPLFTAAGLDRSRFTSAESQWAPYVYADTRAAWIGTRADSPDTPLRVEAAAAGGIPVSFRIVAPWTKPTRMETQAPPTAAKAILVVALIGFGIVGGAMAWLARYSLKTGRGDRRGAARLSGWIFAMVFLSGVLDAHYPARATFASVLVGIQTLILIAASALLFGGIAWLMYIVVEPQLRRFWPQSLVSWTRLLDGQWRDPLVGQHVLVGGTAATMLIALHLVPQVLNSSRVPLLSLPSFTALSGWPHAVSIALQSQSAAISALLNFVLLLLLRFVCRRNSITEIVFVVLFGFLNFAASAALGQVFEGVLGFADIAVMVLLLSRMGLLAAFVFAIYTAMISVLVTTLDVSAWFSGPSLLALAMLAAAGVWAFRVTTAGRPMVSTTFLEQPAGR